MNRIWSIAEQHVNDEASGFGFTFASHPSDDGLDDSTVSLTIYNTERNKKIILMFDRNGLRTSSTVEPHDVQDPAAEALGTTKPSETSSDVLHDVTFEDPGLPTPRPEPAVGPYGETLAAGSGT